MRNSIAVYKWLDVAASGVRFGPDREAVRAELLEHIEDKTADLRRIFPDMTEKEAQDRALEGMGDPEELKVSLAKVHRPWLGWLWTASRLLVWGVLAVGLVLCLVCGIDSGRRGGLAHMQNAWRVEQEMQAVSRAVFAGGVPDWEGERQSVFEPDARVRLDGAEIAVPKAAWWREEGTERLYLQVCVTWDRPWEVNEGIFFHLWAEDSLGNQYWNETENQVPCRGWGSRGLRTVWMNLYLDDVPPEAEQIQIHSRLRGGLDLAVDLEREVKP